MQQIKTNIIWLWVGLAMVALWLIIISVWVVTRGQTSRTLAQDTFTYDETFDTDTYKDAPETDAVWDTSSGEVYLPAGPAGIYNADRVTPGVGNVGGTGVTFVEMALDGDNHPHLAFGASGLKYARWDDALNAWVGSDGTLGLEDVAGALGGTFLGADSVDISVTSAGQPAILWEDSDSGNQGIFYTTYKPGTGWAKANGAAGYDTVESTPGFGFGTISLALDSSDRPNVSYMSSVGTNDVHFERWNGSAYVDIGGATNVTGTGMVSGSAPDHRMVLDSNDDPHIVWSDNGAGSGDVYYVKGSVTGDSWSDVTGAAYSPACLATTCSATNVSNNAGASTRVDLAIDSSSGFPHLVWTDITGLSRNEIFYTEWSGSTWTQADGSAGFQQLSASASLGAASGALVPRIQIDSHNLPVTIWEEKTINGLPGGKSIMGTRWSGTAWSTLDGSAPGVTDFSGQEALTSTRYASLAIDSFDNAAAAWRSSGDAVFGAFWLVPYIAPAIAQSVTVDQTAENIAAATLTANYAVDGADATFYMSNDGGTTFEQVTLGVPHTFATQGSGLQWEVRLQGNPNDVSVTPVIYDLSIDYSLQHTSTRIDKSDPTEQSVAVSRERFPTDGSAEFGVVSRDELLIDAFTVTPLVSRLNATLLLNAPGQLEDTVLAELQRALPSGATVILTGGTEALSTDVEESIKSAGFETLRVGGKNRRETAALLSRELVSRNGAPTTKCFLTEDEALVDALGTGAIAGNLQDGTADCILLTRRNETALDDNARSFLVDNPDVVSLEIIGGQAAVTTGVENILTTSFPGVTTTRIDGANRFATNVNLISKHSAAPTSLVIASGQKESIPGARSISAQSSAATSFFSALLAGPLAAQNQSPLLLVRATELPDESAAYLMSVGATVLNVTIVGSEAEVGSNVETSIIQTLQELQQ